MSTAKLRYAWERNSVDNWQNDIMQTYMNRVDHQLRLHDLAAYDNPNYNVHLLVASLGFKW